MPAKAPMTGEGGRDIVAFDRSDKQCFWIVSLSFLPTSLSVS